MRRTAMSLNAASSVLAIYLLFHPVVRGQTNWGVTYSSLQICASKGSTVDIPCTYTYPPRIDELGTKVEETLWFTKLIGIQSVDLRSCPDYSGRVEYLFELNNCSLRITDLRERDSAEYKFRFTTNQTGDSVTGSPGVTLTVTDLQVTVKRFQTEAELRCESSCNPSDNPSYVWYKDKEEMKEQTSSLRVSDFGKSYSCALKKHEDHRSAAVYAPKFSHVSVNPLGEIRENSPVTLSCRSDGYPTPEFTWYKVNRRGDGRHGKGPELVFSSIQSSDYGQYFCQAGNDLGAMTSKNTFIDVKYAPKLPSVSVSPSGDIVEGSSVTLTCSSDANPAANYTWYKKNETQDLRPFGKGPQLSLESIQSSDFGLYYCEAENKLGWRRSEHFNVHPYYAPKLPSVSVSPSGEIVEGNSVTLTCSSDANPAANYTWYKEDEDSPKASGKMFTIDYTGAEHSGDYVCVAQNEKGPHNSTVRVTVVEVNSTLKINLIRLTLMLLMMAPLLLLTLWMRKKKTQSSTTEPNKPAEMMELDSAVPAAQTEDSTKQEDKV